MLAAIHGTVLYHGVGYLLVECQGLGYKITLPESVAHEFAGDMQLFLHEVIRDDGRELFGFRSIAELELFWKLIAVSGVGPKSAQKIVFSNAVETVKSKIMSGDLAALTDVPGIGKKTAQKIILELKGALAEEPVISLEDAEVLDALLSLGYQKRDAQAALSGLEVTDTESRIRAALKRLSKK